MSTNLARDDVAVRAALDIAARMSSGKIESSNYCLVLSDIDRCVADDVAVSLEYIPVTVKKHDCDGSWSNLAGARSVAVDANKIYEARRECHRILLLFASILPASDEMSIRARSAYRIARAPSDATYSSGTP